MPSTDPLSVVDLVQHADGGLSVAWTRRPGTTPRPLDAATRSTLQRLLDGVDEAERRAHAEGSHEGVTAPRRALGETLFALLDGPERALTRRIAKAREKRRPLRLVVRLRAEAPLDVAAHPAALWRWELLADGRGFVALRASGVRVGVQVGEEVPRAERSRKQGRLRILFMASSAQGVLPVLDHEREEEQLTDALSGFIAEGKVLLRVVEEGNLRRLRERLRKERYDVVHLTGHGALTDQGLRLIMEDAVGARVDVSAEQLLEVLRDAREMPFLVVISSCGSTDGRPDVPSLAAQLVAGGVPCVIGWARPVDDGIATEAARALYGRVSLGRSPLDAAADTRRHLHAQERGQEQAKHAWATMQLLSRQCPGPSVKLTGEETSADAPLTGERYRMLGGHMRVMERGFVGRRRELQRLLRLLREGRDDGRAVAGAVIAGMKGQGKSSLVGRAIDRHRDDVDVAPGLVVLHGALRESEVIEAFRGCAIAWGDPEAQATLDDVAQPVMARVERLLRGAWQARRLVIVLDSFEHNLDVPATGVAQLKPEAAALLEAVVPACLVGQPKVLVTSTAHFALPTKVAGALVEMDLGALEPASVRKLWLRGQEGKELAHLQPQQWEKLAERLGRNARVLDWARQLMGGRKPAELGAVLRRAGKAMKHWKGRAPDEAEQTRLAAVFLEQLAHEAAKASVGDGAMTFVQRARVYDVPVPAEAFAGLTEGTGVDVTTHVPALANLGLLELGSDEEGARVYRVSPLVEGQLREDEEERWHQVSARWFRRAAEGATGAALAERMVMAWMHALVARDQEIADWGADYTQTWAHERGAHADSAELAALHVERFPESLVGALWEGVATLLAGDLARAREKMLRAEQLAMRADVSTDDRRGVIEATAQVLQACGDFDGAAERMERARLLPPAAPLSAAAPDGTQA